LHAQLNKATPTLQHCFNNTVRNKLIQLQVKMFMLKCESQT
jgi:hypothetical protein